MLEVKHIDVFYGVFPALKDVSLRVKEEEIIGIFGPNGHGKSTILKTISGLLVPAKGEIWYKGQRIDRMHTDKIVDAGVTLVPEGKHLFPEMTVKENLLLGAYVSRAWKKRKESLKKVFKIFPRLKERQNQLCRTLSGGERQMCAIGRGLMSSGSLLMLDEPTLGLAPNLSLDIIRKIGEIKENLGISVILVEENVRFMTELSSRIYLIENSKVALEGCKEDILRNERVKEAYLGKIK